MRRLALTAMCIVALCGEGYGNREMLRDADIVTLYRLEELRWCNGLTPAQKGEVLAALKSDRDGVVEMALTVAVVHGMQKSEDFVAAIEQGFNVKVGHSPWLGTLIVEAEKGGQTFEEQLELDKDKKGEPLCRALREWLIGCRVIEEARARRRGIVGDTSFPEESLTSFQKQLLKYSSLPEAEAVETLLGLLREATIAGATDDELASVLATYGDRAFPRVAECLQGKSQQEEPSRAGRHLLVGYIEQIYCLMDRVERSQARELLQRTTSEAEPKLARQIGFALQRFEKYEDVLKTFPGEP